MDILITRPASVGAFDALALSRALQGICGKVLAVTVAQHCDPHAVFVHISEPLTPEERAAIEQVVQAHRAQKQDGA